MIPLIDGMNCGELRALLVGFEDWEKVGIEVEISVRYEEGFRHPQYLLLVSAHTSITGPRLRLRTEDVRLVKECA